MLSHTFKRKDKDTVKYRVEDYLKICYWYEKTKIITLFRSWKDEWTVEYDTVGDWEIDMCWYISREFVYW